MVNVYMYEKKFSVIIPTYNRAAFISIAVNSVLKQTYKKFELIVVDDGSRDRTKRIIENLDDNRVKYLRIPHSGVSFARNTGIHLSSGKYIAFLDSDDKWAESKLERTVEYIKRYPRIQVFHTDEIWYKNGKLLKQKKKHKRPSGFVYKNCLSLCCIGMSTAVIKKEVFDDTGYFDTKLPACEDYDLWLRICSRYEVMLIPEQLTIKYGGRDDQLSNQAGLDKYRIYALEKILENTDLDPGLRELTVKELINKCGIYAKGALKRGRKREAENFFNKISLYKRAIHRD